MAVRGIRGAIQIPENSAAAISSATQELLRTMVEANGIGTETIASAFFTVTTDLNADLPVARWYRDVVTGRADAPSVWRVPIALTG